MTDKQQPDKFDWATELSDAQGHVTLSAQEAKEIGARLRSMGAKLKVYEDLGGAADDVQLLRMGYAAARLEIESLKTQLAERAKEHADELSIAYMCGASREKELAAQQPGAAYAALSEERAAFERWNKDANQGYDLAPCTSGKLQTFESTETEHAWRGFFHGLRPPHGQAPADAKALAEADRRAGEAERLLATCKEDVMRFEQVRSRMKYQWGADQRVSFDEVWDEALALKKAAQAAPATVAGPMAVVKFERGTAGRENEMPRVVSCNWMPDGEYEVYLAAAPTPQPAPQQEPILYDPKALLEVFQTAQAGSSGTAGTLRGIAAVIASWERRTEPHTWLIAAPQPSPAAQGDALDAARYRWLRDGEWDDATHIYVALMNCPDSADDLDTAIDAARAAQEGKSHDN